MKEKAFKERIITYEGSMKQLKKVYNRLANLRLLVILMALYLSYKAIFIGEDGLYILGQWSSYFVFIGLVIYHQTIRSKLSYLERRIQINQAYLDRLSDRWHGFEDTGEDLACETHPYGYDLDIVGPRSLFQKINITMTWHGRQALGHALLSPDFNTEKLIQRQQAISELAKNYTFCEMFQSLKTKKQDDSLKNLVEDLKEVGDFKVTSTINSLSLAVFAIWASLILGYFFTGQTIWLWFIGILGFALFGIYMFFYGKLSKNLASIRELEHLLTAYEQMIECFSKEVFYAPLLKNYQEKLGGASASALKAIKALRKLSMWSHMTLQPLLAIPLNVFFLWDFRCIYKLNVWKEENGIAFREWLEMMGEIESLVSLSVLPCIEEEMSMPLFEKKSKLFKADQIGHPLIQIDQRVCNDLSFEEAFLIITGSNMSGKTTFLRTIGINLVLAYSGAPVCCRQMTTGFYKLYTSMRIKDDLQAGISTFYAELLRIKQMIEAAQRNENSMCLIDEIFRGTNSIDRIDGAKSVLKTLLSHGAMGGITTHDLELCQLEHEGRAVNYHFTETYDHKSILFDYKLKEGISTTTNARYLMEMVGIPIE